MSYPVGEATPTGFLLVGGQIGGIGLVFLLDWLIDEDQQHIAGYVVAGCIAVAGLLACVMFPRMRRREYEQAHLLPASSQTTTLNAWEKESGGVCTFYLLLLFIYLSIFCLTFIGVPRTSLLSCIMGGIVSWEWAEEGQGTTEKEASAPPPRNEERKPEVNAEEEAKKRAEERERKRQEDLKVRLSCQTNFNSIPPLE